MVRCSRARWGLEVQGVTLAELLSPWLSPSTPNRDGRPETKGDRDR